MYSCIIESFRCSALVIGHSISNTPGPRLHSLSEIKATIILGIVSRVSVSVFHSRTPIQVNAPVEIVEEGQQIEAELDETLLLVPRQRPENFCRVIHVVFVADPAGMKHSHSW